MKKRISRGKQVILGAGITSFLWIIAFLACDPFGWLLYSDISGFLLSFIIIAVPFFNSAYLLVLSIISKKYNYKKLYFSALAAVCLPVLAYLFNELNLSDSSIFSWILNLTVGLVLYPAGIICVEVIENAAFELSYSMEGTYIVAVMIVFIIVSAILYKTVKAKQEKLSPATEKNE